MSSRIDVAIDVVGTVRRGTAQPAPLGGILDSGHGARYGGVGSGLSATQICVRLFLTCWLVYVMHFASNTVREVYLALAIGDHFSFRVDEYANMHPDLFEKPGYGWHIGANPGVSMIGAIPYALARPMIDRVVERVNRERRERRTADAPPYHSPYPMAQEFFAEAWRRGLDVKFALGAFVMQALAMAPSSALGVVAMFLLLRRLMFSDRSALWLAFLYAFGTPVFFRTGYLNHNLMLAHVAFLGWLALWNRDGRQAWSPESRFFLGGLAGGAAVLLDYSGIVLCGTLLAYGIGVRVREGARVRLREVGAYALGAVGPIGLLWLYQWRSFGHPFLPGQHWMPPVEWIERGYQGVQMPQLDLFVMLGFDHRFGLFIAAPILALALACPFVDRGRARRLPRLELAFVFVTFVSLWLLLSGINYTRLQFNTGIRYFAAILPFLFVPAAIVLARLPRPVIFAVALLAVAQSWCLAMYRDVERGLGILEPVLQVLIGGFQLPVLTVASRMPGVFGEYVARGVSPLPLFVLAAAVIYGLWADFSTRTST
jgi:hypothetical protein